MIPITEGKISSNIKNPPESKRPNPPKGILPIDVFTSKMMINIASALSFLLKENKDYINEK